MWMSEHEITRSYLEAEDQKTQISILSELNLCSEKDIIDILASRGSLKKGGPKLLSERMELYQKGLSDVEIGRLTGYDPSTIRYWRKCRGLPPNYPKRGNHHA